MSGSSDYTLTPNLGLFKPNYDMDDGQWGYHLNTNADTLDGVINTLQTTPIPQPSNVVPIIEGTAAVGTSALYARADHVHPAAGGSGTVTSMQMSGGTTGLTYSGGPITTSGTITTAGTLALANGGTGATTAGAALTNLGAYAASNPSGYQTAANVTTALAPYAPLAAPVFTGDARAVTATYGDNDTSVATTAFVQTAVGIAANVNVANNSGFAINQRGYTSGTALAASAYGHDRWKAGSDGCTYTFAAPAGPINAITITAGSLQQVIEGASLAGGSYTLSWTGTAQGRVGAASYAASPVTATVTAGTNATIEFNTGTLGQVKFERGTLPSTWLGKPYGDELRDCQRFYQVAGAYYWGRLNASDTPIFTLSLPASMRSAPTIGTSANADTNLSSPGSGQVAGSGNAQIYVTGTVGTSGAFVLNRTLTLSADL